METPPLSKQSLSISIFITFGIITYMEMTWPFKTYIENPINDSNNDTKDHYKELGSFHILLASADTKLREASIHVYFWFQHVYKRAKHSSCSLGNKTSKTLIFLLLLISGIESHPGPKPSNS
jgi:hypothetical protein